VVTATVGLVDGIAITSGWYLATKAHSVQYCPVVNVIGFTACLGEVHSSPTVMSPGCVWVAVNSQERWSANAEGAVQRDRKAQLGTKRPPSSRG